MVVVKEMVAWLHTVAFDCLDEAARLKLVTAFLAEQSTSVTPPPAIPTIPA